MARDEAFRESIRKLISGEIRFDERADRHTSLGVGGRIDALAFPRNEAELCSVAAFLRGARIPFLPVGNWTNLIVTEGGYRGVLVSLNRLNSLQWKDDREGGVLLEAQAGVALSEMVRLCTQEALTGMEFCIGIPGSVGGGVRMNAGAYGSEMKDILISVRLLDSGGTIRTELRNRLHFQYRSLDLPAETIIIGVAFRVQRGERGKIADRVRELLELRRERHPLDFRNAGSVFKNPRDIPAGRLIEEAGLKGTRIGDAQVSEKHGNFIINRGKATAGEVLCLIALIQKQVFEMTGHALETEVRIIGE